jgi:hypothetical protein
MSGLLNNSPADIVRHLLVNKGVFTVPYEGGVWPCFYNYLPDGEEPLFDQVACIYDTTGLKQGRTANDGETLKAHGFMVSIQDLDQQVAYVKAVQVCNAFDVLVKRNLVIIDGNQYGVSTISQTGDINRLGRNAMAKHRRSSCTVNAIVILRAISQVGTGTGSGTGSGTAN